MTGKVSLSEEKFQSNSLKEYVDLYEHAPQMKAADVSEYRQLASFGDTVMAAKYSENHGFEFVTWKQNTDGNAVFWGDYSPNYEYAKESFAVRSGLIPESRLFSEQETANLFRCVDFANLLPGSAQWGFWPMSGGWLCRHLFERYRYTGDKAFLRNTAWPVMKQAALFYVSLLQEDADGTVYLTPSTSPENGYLLEGERCTVDKTATMTTAILRELFENLLTCGERLGIRDELLDMVRGLLVRLKPYKISETGALMEWNQDYPEAEVTHRHLSHLYGLYPGNDTALHTPALREACRQTLLRRSDEGTGWSMAWKVCLWARLGDGEHAKQLIDRQLRPVSGGETGHDAGGGSYSSLLCAHPPFQIDGNFGVCAGIAEMLCDDTDDQPRLLPALPAAWTEGAVRGMRIRGGAVVDFSWKNGQVTACHMAGAAAEDAD